MTLTITLSAIIGLLLGLLGGGGSILTVPMLVYVLHLEPKNAVVTSFVVVGVSSLMALIPHARRGSVCWKSGVVFGFTGMIGAFAGGRMAGHFSGDGLMTLFGVVSLVTGIQVLSRTKPRLLPGLENAPNKICPLSVPFLRVLFDGFFVGGLTGMVGVGGGFLIVPALTLMVGIPMQGAVGTSLLIITMNAVAGLIGYSGHVTPDLHLTMLIAVAAIVGSAVGAWLSAYVNPKWLRRVFGAMVVLVAGYVLSQSVTPRLIDSIESWFGNPHKLKWTLLGLLVCWLILRISRWIHGADVTLLPSADNSLE
jgi:uncharacterized membrane protein YfcA